jgi:branched-chain amino acid transport system permease protein
VSIDLLYDAVISGILLGCFYAALSLGLSMAFGLVDVPHIAHPTFLVLGGYGAFVLGTYGVDPILAGLLLVPVFYFAGLLVYQFYYASFEKHGADTGVRGLAFFFGFSFVLEAALILTFGVDQHMVEASYIGGSYSIGATRLPLRMLVACGFGLALTAGLSLYLSRTFTGRALKAVAQDAGALMLIGANPVRIKRIGFAVATGLTAIGGALLAVAGPIEPGLGRLYIGRVFCIVVLAGMGSIPGTLVAALIVGIAESVVLSSGGASWAGAVSFGMLLLVLAFRPSGLFGR